MSHMSKQNNIFPPKYNSFKEQAVARLQKGIHLLSSFFLGQQQSDVNPFDFPLPRLHLQQPGINCMNCQASRLHAAKKYTERET